MEVKIKKIEDGVLPAYKREGDVCMDCYSRTDIVVEKKKEDIMGVTERTLVPLGFALELPFGYEAIIRPRSGLSKEGIDIAIGTVDTNYRGEVMACVINNTCKDYVIHKGDRICQLAIRKAPIISWKIVEELSDTERGSNGFGSSGIK